MKTRKETRDPEAENAKLRSALVDAEAERDSLRSTVAGLESERDALKAQIGQPPPGSHPAEAVPRDETWHKERANWNREVERLRAHNDSLRSAAVALLPFLPNDTRLDQHSEHARATTALDAALSTQAPEVKTP